MESHVTLRTQAAVGKAAGIDQRTVGRILSGSHSPTLERVDALARCFGLLAWQLLIPGLDPKNPPIAQRSTETELYARIRRLMSELPPT